MARRGKGVARRGGYKRDRRGRFAHVSAGAAKAGYSRTRRGDRRGATYTRTISSGKGSKRIGARDYVTINSKGRLRQRATVVNLANRGTAPANSRITRSTVARRGGPRPGIPVRGNRNMRYVSEKHARIRAASIPGHPVRRFGRAHSRVTVMRANRARQAPTSGYLVAYS